jgi:hypothetical protein
VRAQGWPASRQPSRLVISCPRGLGAHPREPDLAGRCTAWLPIRHPFLSVMPTRLCMRSLSLTPGSSSDCASYAGFPGSAAAGMRLSESSNVAAPGRCAHHPGITPGGVICGDRDGPMDRGVRVASPRVPASTLISHRRGGVAARIRVPGPPSVPGICQKGSVEPGNLRACRGGLSGRTCLLRSDDTAPPGDLGRCTSGSRRRRIHPAAGDR